MPESHNTEWKRTWRDDYVKWICGFANANGGVIEIGRADDGTPVGVPDAARLLEDVPNKVRDILGIMLESNLVAGRQDCTDPERLVRGQSITDACIDLAETEGLLETLAQASATRRKACSTGTHLQM